jgi:SnoaL-like protein
MTDTTTQTTDLTTLVDTYLDAWNERDAGRRGELVSRAWAEEGQLADPPLTGSGHAGISDVAAAMHQQFPDHRFERTSGVDEHHGFLRFGWNLTGPDGTVATNGIDVGVVGEDGRLARIVGFFGDLPAKEAA